MSDITLSSAVRSNLLNLQQTATLLGKTQERLATGLKVNSALDNPTNFFTASSLNARSADLGRLLDSVSNAVQTIAAADKGLTALTKLVESAQATARQALQTAATVDEPTAATGGLLAGGAFTAVDVSDPLVAATSGTIEGGAFTAVDFTNGGSDDGQIAFDIDIDGAGVQSITIGFADVDGVAADNAAVTAAELADIINTKLNAAFTTTGETYAVVNGTGGIDISSVTTGTTSTVEITNFAVTNGASGSGLADGDEAGTDGSGDSITFALTLDGGSAVNISIDDATVDAYNTDNSASLDSSALTAADIAALINDQAGATVASVVDGALQIASTTTGTTSNVTIASYTANVSGGSTGLADGTDAGTAATTSSVANPKRDELRVQYNDLLDQIDQLAKDTGFNGVNLLNGDSLSVLFNEDGSSSLDVTGVTYDSTGLGLEALVAGDFDLNADINGTLDTLKEAIDTLRSQASKFGSNLSVVETRQDFTKNMINVLETGAANLTLADTNEEAANLLALQTRQQLSSTALSLASQADQNVLRLF